MRLSNAATRAADWIQGALSSRWLLWTVIALFAIVSSWIAVTGASGFLYDEAYHFGIVQVYTHQWSPFIAQGDHYAELGDISRYGSYLYHYLASMPVRFVSWIGGDIRAQLVTARLFSVACMTAALPVFWLLLREIGSSRAVSSLSVLLYTAIPIVPALASTVNYDNLMILLTAAFLLVSVRIYRAETISLAAIASVIALGCLGSITKYTFLPIFGGAGIVLVIALVIRVRRHKVTIAWKERTASFWLWGVLAVIGLGLVVERYVVNLIAYHSLQPDCRVLHSTSFCLQYGVWKRNYDLAATAPHIPVGPGSVIAFFFRHWIPGNLSSLQYVGLFQFSSGGGASTAAVLTIGAAISVALIVISSGWLAKKRGLAVIGAGAALYVLSLLAVNLRDYFKTGQPVGVQGRYLLPFAPVVIALTGMAIGHIYDRLYARATIPKALTVLLVLLCATQGGGPITYFGFATDNWWSVTGWPLSVNHALTWLSNKLMI